MGEHGAMGKRCAYRDPGQKLITLSVEAGLETVD